MHAWSELNALKKEEKLATIYDKLSLTKLTYFFLHLFRTFGHNHKDRRD